MKKTLLFISLFISTLVFGQGSLEYGAGLKLKINEEGTKYIRFIAWNQIWVRAMEMNPGTNVGDVPTQNHADIGLRRLRFLAVAQISPRYMIVTHFGINNQTFLNGGNSGTAGTGPNGLGKKPALFFHDAWNEYALIQQKEGKKFSLTMGAGLHYLLGLSRMSMGSTLNFMTIDAPIFNWALIENGDQFARQMGVFFKGKYDRLEYRVSINKPFYTSIVPSDFANSNDAIAVDNNGNGKYAFAGYFDYHFLDKESNYLPFKVGTYVGTKKVFNIGAGFYFAPNSTRSSVLNTVSEHDILLSSADIFLDMPIGKTEKKMAITAYSVFYNYQFGPNYLRNIGIMNVGSLNPNFTGTHALAGVGNAQPLIGTGQIWYTQIGVLLPNSKEKPKVRIQPFGAYTYKKFERLDKASSQFDIGANFFLDGHHAKITPQFSTRPVYTTNSSYSLKSEFLLQFQVYL